MFEWKFGRAVSWTWTDPAHPDVEDPAAAALRSEAAEEGMLSSALSALVFLAGVWLVLAPFALDYPDGFDGRWNDIVVGVAVAVVALVRMAAPIRTVTVGLVNIGPILVALREAGQPPVAREHRARPIDGYLDKID